MMLAVGVHRNTKLNISSKVKKNIFDKKYCNSENGMESSWLRVKRDFLVLLD